MKMNILDYIDYLMHEEGFTEEEAELMAAEVFNLYEPDDSNDL